jgi:hypothetical protein
MPRSPVRLDQLPQDIHSLLRPLLPASSNAALAASSRSLRDLYQPHVRGALVAHARSVWKWTPSVHADRVLPSIVRRVARRKWCLECGRLRKRRFHVGYVYRLCCCRKIVTRRCATALLPERWRNKLCGNCALRLARPQLWADTWFDSQFCRGLYMFCSRCEPDLPCADPVDVWECAAINSRESL